MHPTIPRERFLGCLLGLVVGDALGAPYEALTDQDIFFTFGSTRELVSRPSAERLYFTDDTQMTIGVAEALVDGGETVEASLCRAFTSNYDPERKYGPGARRILEAMIAGEDWRGLAASIFPGGSLGNGAAMRVAPVGLLFSDDQDRLAEQATASALPTHLHPLGIEGARLMALAVALAARGPAFDRV